MNGRISVSARSGRKEFEVRRSGRIGGVLRSEEEMKESSGCEYGIVVVVVVPLFGICVLVMVFWVGMFS